MNLSKTELDPKNAFQAIEEMGRTMNPNKRAGKPEEVAKAITFLASEDAAMINGVILPIDGARHLAFPERAKID